MRSVATQYASKVYHYADELRAAGKKVILGGIHVTVCPEEAVGHADAIVTGEAELLWPRSARICWPEGSRSVMTARRPRPLRCGR